MKEYKSLSYKETREMEQPRRPNLNKNNCFNKLHANRKDIKFHNPKKSRAIFSKKEYQ